MIEGKGREADELFVDVTSHTPTQIGFLRRIGVDCGERETVTVLVVNSPPVGVSTGLVVIRWINLRTPIIYAPISMVHPAAGRMEKSSQGLALGGVEPTEKSPQRC
jgi:hypothetical protein